MATKAKFTIFIIYLLVMPTVIKCQIQVHLYIVFRTTLEHTLCPTKRLIFMTLRLACV